MTRGALTSRTELVLDPAVVGPTTQDDLTDELRFAGLQTGDLVLVHSSLRSLGFVVGGAQAVVGALLDAVGPTGTIVVPTHSDPWSEPSHWIDPPLPDDWHDVIRANLPAFHPRVTPTSRMGAVVECARRWPGFVRSWHPRVSFGAIGPQAEAVLDDHALASGFGERSPVGRLYAAGGRILLLGVGHGNSSALHLAEHRARWPTKRWITQGAAITVDGTRQWVEWRELDHHADDFERIGEAIAAAGIESTGWVGATTARLMPVRDAVDLATDWMSINRD
jgi:aminoglycoside 3-N-acetyltransferase